LASSSYYYRPVSKRKPRTLDGELVAAINTVRKGYNEVYGYRKVTRALRAKQMTVNGKKVLRHLRALGLTQPRKVKGQRWTHPVLVKPDAEIKTVRQAILDRFGQERKLFALPAAEFKVEVRKILDRSFVMTNAVNILTLVIAGLGIIVTLLASVLERTREIGILRGIGMTRSQVSGVVIIESALIGAIGGVLGAATGILIGWIEVEGIFRLDFGASIGYHVHYPAIGLALLLAIGLSTLAGLYPARRAAGTNIVEALSYE